MNEGNPSRVADTQRAKIMIGVIITPRYVPYNQIQKKKQNKNTEMKLFITKQYGYHLYIIDKMLNKKKEAD